MKKNNIIIIVLVAIIVVLGIVVAITVPTYLSAQKKETNQTETNQTETKKTETKETETKETEETTTNASISEEEAKELYEGLFTLGTTISTNGCGKLDFDYFKDYTVKATDLSQEMVGYVVLNHLHKEGFKFNEGDTFTKTKVHEIINKVYGSSYQYEDHSIAFCPSITYDGNETYTIGQGGCGGACGPGSKAEFESYKMENDTVYIYARVLFNSNGAYFKDYAHTQSVENNIENGGLYKLTFKNENGNYVFKSSELA